MENQNLHEVMSEEIGSKRKEQLENFFDDPTAKEMAFSYTNDVIKAGDAIKARGVIAGNDKVLTAGANEFTRDAFKRCEPLASIKIPPNDKALTAEADELEDPFQKCKPLDSIKIPPKEADELIDDPFQKCKPLDSIKIPPNVQQAISGIQKAITEQTKENEGHSLGD